MAASVTLSIPGLFGPWPEAQQPGFLLPELPGLNWLLGRADHKKGSQQLWQASRSQAEYSYLSDFGKWPDGPVLIAEPLHLRADQRHVRVYGSDMLKLTFEDADPLVDALNEFVRDDGLCFEAATPGRWYLHLTFEHHMQFAPLLMTLGKAMDEYLPIGDAATRWHGWMNEWQMLLFAHPQNQHRLNSNALAANGVWLWGEQQASYPCIDGYKRIFTDDPSLKGAALNQERHALSLPAGLDHIDLGRDGDCFVDLNQLVRSVAYHDYEQWTQALSELEHLWFTPLAMALKRSAIQSVTIKTCSERWDHDFILTPYARWKFWCKQQPLMGWLESA